MQVYLWLHPKELSPIGAILPIFFASNMSRCPVTYVTRPLLQHLLKYLFQQLSYITILRDMCALLLDLLLVTDFMGYAWSLLPKKYYSSAPQIKRSFCCWSIVSQKSAKWSALWGWLLAWAVKECGARRQVQLWMEMPNVKFSANVKKSSEKSFTTIISTKMIMSQFWNGNHALMN